MVSLIIIEGSVVLLTPSLHPCILPRLQGRQEPSKEASIQLQGLHRDVLMRTKFCFSNGHHGTDTLFVHQKLQLSMSKSCNLVQLIASLSDDIRHTKGTNAA